jgi:hypothetical protein
MNTNDLAHIHARRIELSLRRKDFAAAEIALRDAIEAVEMFADVTVDSHIETLGLSQKMNEVLEELGVVRVFDLLSLGSHGLRKHGLECNTRDKIKQALLVHGFEF